MGAMSDATIPWVASVSYGNDEVQQTSVAYMESVNAAMQQLGARGVTVLFASGDQGPCGRSGCSDVYHPDFPAASPYVTAVGGTDFAAAGVIGDEKAWVDGGGGFSNTFAAPQYQTAAIAAYVKTAGAAMPPQAKWNATGRAYPDVSALAGEQNPYCMSVGSLMGISVAGTSAATPVVAAMIGRLNAVRLASGGKPLGFANPWLYSKAAPGGGFHDVTQGTITGGGSDGFPAVKGACVTVAAARSGASASYVKHTLSAAVHGLLPLPQADTSLFVLFAPMFVCVLFMIVCGVSWQAGMRPLGGARRCTRRWRRPCDACPHGRPVDALVMRRSCDRTLGRPPLKHHARRRCSW